MMTWGYVLSKRYIVMTESNFGYEKINDKEHSFRVRDVFNKVANKYDFMNDVMSLGMQRLWKKTFINSIKGHSPEGLNVVDLAHDNYCSVWNEKYNDNSNWCEHNINKLMIN